MSSKLVKVRKGSSVEAFGVKIEVISHMHTIVRLCLTREEVESFGCKMGVTCIDSMMELSLKVIEKINGWYSIEVVNLREAQETHNSLEKELRDKVREKGTIIGKLNQRLQSLECDLREAKEALASVRRSLAYAKTANAEWQRGYNELKSSTEFDNLALLQRENQELSGFLRVLQMTLESNPKLFQLFLKNWNALRAEVQKKKKGKDTSTAMEVNPAVSAGVKKRVKKKQGEQKKGKQTKKGKKKKKIKKVKNLAKRTTSKSIVKQLLTLD